jgi:hypothetical protein
MNEAAFGQRHLALFCACCSCCSMSCKNSLVSRPIEREAIHKVATLAETQSRSASSVYIKIEELLVKCFLVNTTEIILAKPHFIYNFYADTL